MSSHLTPALRFSVLGLARFMVDITEYQRAWQPSVSDAVEETAAGMNHYVSMILKESEGKGFSVR